jgi:hypothetical protein
MTGMANEKALESAAHSRVNLLELSDRQSGFRAKDSFCARERDCRALAPQPHTGTTDSFRLLPSSTFCWGPASQGVDLVGRPAGDRCVGLDQAGRLAESAL